MGLGESPGGRGVISEETTLSGRPPGGSLCRRSKALPAHHDEVAPEGLLSRLRTPCENADPDTVVTSRGTKGAPRATRHRHAAGNDPSHHPKSADHTSHLPPNTTGPETGPAGNRGRLRKPSPVQAPRYVSHAISIYAMNGGGTAGSLPIIMVSSFQPAQAHTHWGGQGMTQGLGGQVRRCEKVKDATVCRGSNKKAHPLPGGREASGVGRKKAESGKNRIRRNPIKAFENRWTVSVFSTSRAVTEKG